MRHVFVNKWCTSLILIDVLNRISPSPLPSIKVSATAYFTGVDIPVSVFPSLSDLYDFIHHDDKINSESRGIPRIMVQTGLNSAEDDRYVGWLMSDFCAPDESHFVLRGSVRSVKLLKNVLAGRNSDEDGLKEDDHKLGDDLLRGTIRSRNASACIYVYLNNERCEEMFSNFPLDFFPDIAELWALLPKRIEEYKRNLLAMEDVKSSDVSEILDTNSVRRTARQHLNNGDKNNMNLTEQAPTNQNTHLHSTTKSTRSPHKGDLCNFYFTYIFGGFALGTDVLFVRNRIRKYIQQPNVTLLLSRLTSPRDGLDSLFGATHHHPVVRGVLENMRRTLIPWHYLAWCCASFFTEAKRFVFGSRGNLEEFGDHESSSHSRHVHVVEAPSRKISTDNNGIKNSTLMMSSSRLLAPIGGDTSRTSISTSSFESKTFPPAQQISMMRQKKVVLLQSVIPLFPQNDQRYRFVNIVEPPRYGGEIIMRHFSMMADGKAMLDSFVGHSEVFSTGYNLRELSRAAPLQAQPFFDYYSRWLEREEFMEENKMKDNKDGGVLSTTSKNAGGGDHISLGGEVAQATSRTSSQINDPTSSLPPTAVQERKQNELSDREEAHDLLLYSFKRCVFLCPCKQVVWNELSL